MSCVSAHSVMLPAQRVSVVWQQQPLLLLRAVLHLDAVCMSSCELGVLQ